MVEEIIVPNELYMTTPEGKDIVIETKLPVYKCVFGDKVRIGEEVRYVLGVQYITHWFFDSYYSLVLKKENTYSQTLLQDNKDFDPNNLEVTPRTPESLISFYNNPIISEHLGTMFVTTGRYVKGKKKDENALINWLKAILTNSQIEFAAKKTYLHAFFITHKERHKQKNYFDGIEKIDATNWEEFVKKILLHLTKNLLATLLAKKSSSTEICDLIILNCFMLEMINSQDNVSFIKQAIDENKIEFTSLQLITEAANGFFIHMQSRLTDIQKNYFKPFLSLSQQYRKDLHRVMKTPPLLYVETCDGAQIELSTDCTSFGLKFGDRVKTTSKGSGYVIGISPALNGSLKNKLWIKLDGNNYTSNWQEPSNAGNLNTPSLTVKTIDLTSITHFFATDDMNIYLAKTIWQTFFHFLAPLSQQNLNELLSWLYQIIGDEEIDDNKKMIYLECLQNILKHIRGSNATNPEEKPIYESWRNTKTIEMYAFISGTIQSRLVSGETLNLKFLLELFHLLTKIEKSFFYESIKRDIMSLKSIFANNIKDFSNYFLQNLHSLLFTQNDFIVTTTIEELSDLVKTSYFTTHYSPSITGPSSKNQATLTLFINAKINDIYLTSYQSYSIQQKKYLDDLILTTLSPIIADTKTLTTITKDQFALILSLIKHICLTSKLKQKEMPAWYQVRITELYEICSEKIPSQLRNENISTSINLFSLLHTIETSHFNTPSSSIKELKASLANNIRDSAITFFQKLLAQLSNQNTQEADLIDLIKINFYLSSYTDHEIDKEATLKKLVRETKLPSNGPHIPEKPLTIVEAKTCIQKIKAFYDKYKDLLTVEQQKYLSDLIQALPVPLSSIQTKETYDWNYWSTKKPTEHTIQMQPLDSTF